MLTTSIDIVAKKHGGGRGLAFIAFEEQAAATAAYRALQDEKFYGRSLRISYSKTESNAIVARNNPGMSKEAAALEAARMVVSRAQDEYEALERDREAAENDMKRKAGEGDEPPAKRVKGEDEDDMEIEMEDDDDGESRSGESERAWMCDGRVKMACRAMMLADCRRSSTRNSLSEMTYRRKCMLTYSQWLIFIIIKRHLLQLASRVQRRHHGCLVLTVSDPTAPIRTSLITDIPGSQKQHNCHHQHHCQRRTQRQTPEPRTSE